MPIPTCEISIICLVKYVQAQEKGKCFFSCAYGRAISPQWTRAFSFANKEHSSPFYMGVPLPGHDRQDIYPHLPISGDS